MREEIENPFLENKCFFCGKDNPEGLKLKFYLDRESEEVFTEYLPTRRFTGQGDILHGAIQMGLLDEIMGWTSYAFTKEMAVTTDLNVRFVHPTYINGEKIGVRCRVISKKGPKVSMEATLLNKEGQVCTSATGTYHRLPPNKYKDLIQGK